MVTNPLPGDLSTLSLLLERSVLSKSGCSQTLNKGKIKGRFVVTTAMKFSPVPHSAASAPPSSGVLCCSQYFDDVVSGVTGPVVRRFGSWESPRAILVTMT
jgi:hypothetical protein